MSRLKLEALRCELQPYVNQLNTTENRRRYIAGDFPRADKVNDLNVRGSWAVTIRTWRAYLNP